MSPYQFGGILQGTKSNDPVSTVSHCWGLVGVSTVESSCTPVDGLGGTFSIGGNDGGVDFLGDAIATVHHAAGHVHSVTWVTLDQC